MAPVDRRVRDGKELIQRNPRRRRDLQSTEDPLDSIRHQLNHISIPNIQTSVYLFITSHDSKSTEKPKDRQTDWHEAGEDRDIHPKGNDARNGE